MPIIKDNSLLKQLFFRLKNFSRNSISYQFKKIGLNLKFSPRMTFILAITFSLGFLTTWLFYPEISQAQQAQGRMRILTFNVIKNAVVDATATKDKDKNCSPGRLQYQMDQAKFIIQYMKQNNVNIGLFQEMYSVCNDPPLKKDAQNRTIVDYESMSTSSRAEQVAKNFKQWFKDNYSYQNNTGRSMTDAEFEQELNKVWGRAVTEDVWIRFLPFDTTFWAAAISLFVENYPMQVTTKPFASDTQAMRVATFSTYPYSRTVNYAKNADMIPFPNKEQRDQENFDTKSSTRWAVNTPVVSPFGNMNVYNVHPRGEYSCTGARLILNIAHNNKSADEPFYVLGGDFNARFVSPQGQPDDECESEYRILWRNETEANDESTAKGLKPIKTHVTDTFPPSNNKEEILKNILHNKYQYVISDKARIDNIIVRNDFSVNGQPLSFDLSSRKMMTGNPESDHQGYSVDLVGPLVRQPPELENIKLPDYKQPGKDAQPSPDSPIIVPNKKANQCFADFLTDFNAIKSKPNVEGMLLFSPFGDNGDENFQKHIIPASYMNEICPPSGNCQGTKVGFNPGTMFGGPGKERAQNQFDWFLQIADGNKPEDVIAVIKNQPKHTKVIIRIGIADSGLNFTVDPNFYVNYLKSIYDQLNQEERDRTYAIAGPNEPDIEWKWFAKECGGHGEPGDQKSMKFYSCIGKILADYMNAIISGNPGFKLLSPAFNMTSFTLQDQKVTSGPKGIFHAMNEAGANWSGLYGIAGNIYPNQAPMTEHWASNNIDEILSITGKPLVITETGPYNCQLEEEANFEDYYIHPIKGFDSSYGQDPKTTTDTIRDDLISQGYRAMCAGPGFKVGVTASGLEAMGILFAQRPPDYRGVVMGNDPMTETPQATNFVFYQNPRIYSVLSTDYREALIPIFRDVDGFPGLKQSFEQYFSQKAGPNAKEEYSKTETESSAINSLVTKPQRCALSYLNLMSRDAMCKKLNDPTACSLYATKIKGTAFNAKSLLEEFGRYTSTAVVSQNLTNTCQQLLFNEDSRWDALRTGMLNAPLEMEESYRLAFMLTSMRLRFPSSSTYVNFFTHPLGGWNGPPHPKHTVIVSAFKIPDILTNKGAIDDGLMNERNAGSPNYLSSLATGTSGNTSFLDPAILTRNSLIPNEKAYEYERQQRCQRNVLQKAAQAVGAMKQDDSWAEIECIINEGGNTGGVGNPQCKDPLTRALVDIVNTQAMLTSSTNIELDYCAVNPDEVARQAVAGAKPSDQQLGNLADEKDSGGEEDLACTTRMETADYINDPGTLNPLSNPSRTFTEEWGVAFLEKLFSQDNCTHRTPNGDKDPGFASTQKGDCDEDWSIKSRFFVTPDQHVPGGAITNDLSVNHFLIYPVGYDLRTVEAVLAGSFFSTRQIQDLIEQAESKDRFEITETTTSFVGDGQSWSFTEGRKEECKEEKYKDINGEERIKYICPTYTLSFQTLATKAPKPQTILGAKLGFWLHSVQRSLVATSQQTYKYLAGCRNTQEFLLDMCGGDLASLIGTPGGATIPVGNNGSSDQCNSTTPLEAFDYYGESPTTFIGVATMYAEGVMQSVLMNKLNGAAGSYMVGNSTLVNCELDDLNNNPNPTLPNGEKYVGCVALLRVGDLYYRTAYDSGRPDPNAIKSIYIQTAGGLVQGPFAVIDVARDVHAPCLYDGSWHGGKRWAVDIDFPSYARLFPRGATRVARVCSSRTDCETSRPPTNEDATIGSSANPQ